MITIPQHELNEFKDIFENKYKLCVNSCNIYFQTIRLINKHHSFLTKDDFDAFYYNITRDIELVSNPYEAFIPDKAEMENPNVRRVFIVNRDVPEYVRIQKRVTLDDLFNTIPPEHEVHMLLKENSSKLVDVVDDVFIYWSVHKYLDAIDQLRLQSISCMTPIIEYVVNNITMNDWKDYLSSKRINEDKCEKYLTADVIFQPDFDHTVEFYKEDHNDVFAFDVSNLIERMCTNIIVKTDIYMIIAVYLILTFSKVDIKNESYDISPCAAYVRDILSRL